MADVTAALVTFNEIAICGSDGSKMLVASVPMAARTERTAIGRAPETGTARGAVLDVSHWAAMGTFALVGIGRVQSGEGPGLRHSPGPFFRIARAICGPRARFPWRR